MADSPYERVIADAAAHQAEIARAESEAQRLDFPGLVQLSAQRYAVLEVASFRRTRVPGSELMPVVEYRLATKPAIYAQALMDLARARATHTTKENSNG